jgi:hypothetical protein
MRQVKLDPEERIIAAALDQTALYEANERGAGARIEIASSGDESANNRFCCGDGFTRQRQASDKNAGQGRRVMIAK